MIGSRSVQQGPAATFGGAPEVGIPALPPEPLQQHSPGAGTQAVDTVSMALLAYGLVQLVGRLVDKLPIGRAGGVDWRRAAASAHGAEGREMVRRLWELGKAGHDRLEHLQELLQNQQRLIGQVLGDLRETDMKLDNVLRKLRALWRRVGRRRSDP